MRKAFLIITGFIIILITSLAWKGKDPSSEKQLTAPKSVSGITESCVSTHIFNDCTGGYLTFGFSPTTGANTANPDPLTIQQSNMSVGIFVNNPQAKLHIKGSGATNATSAFLVNNNANAEVFRILDNGYIGIGTSTPQSELAVNGVVTTKKVRLTPEGWPDYVFEKNYSLPDLQTVAQYIAIHKHLPGIESEKEVLKNGIELGENQAQLLRKIEELTLYLIQQNKELQQLKSENEILAKQQTSLLKQQQQIDALKEMITRITAKN